MVSKLSFIFKCLKPFYIIKSVDKPNYVIILHRRCSSTVSSESCPPLVESVQFSVVHLVVHRGRPWTGNQCFVHHCYQINFTFHLLPHFLTIPEHFIVILIATNMHVNQNETEGTGVEASVDVSQFCFV